ncbi:hypothetical protein JCGZ_04957 [Jatropha curcas]|uniref:Uncharacterized protein n=1 Tax=Jatropha curcas TaxID=180498 RepID=A0A067L2T0_JATCU|nr:hypothetical protein JCGZ_04957 [Jatropha curcas]
MKMAHTVRRKSLSYLLVGSVRKSEKVYLWSGLRKGQDEARVFVSWPDPTKACNYWLNWACDLNMLGPDPTWPTGRMKN